MSNETEIISYINMHPLYIEIKWLLYKIRNLRSIHASTDDKSIKLPENIINIFGSAEQFPSNINCLFNLSIYNLNINPTCEKNLLGYMVYLPFTFQFIWDSDIIIFTEISFNLCKVYHHINIDRKLYTKFIISTKQYTLNRFYFSKEIVKIVLQELVLLLRSVISITEKTKIQTELLNDIKLFPVII